ncbi:uncharacterized protein LOC131653720 [Vicia villosa]|uniref:uncharacterized protein LOC131653720 n=1 Tax=Vicia villosa TaxID=3911 RepID=UPI00273ADD88|nr:uncharacterized protein LOC131653720 [Vicia villosa]
MSDMLRRVRENHELHGIRPNWIGEEVFHDLVTYWRSPEFRAKSETFKKMRASEKGGCVNTVGSISTAEHARRLAKELGRKPLMPELISRTRTRRSGGFVDERTKLYLEDYDRRLAIFLENNPQFMPAEGEPLNADVDHYIWCEVIKEKGPNGCFFGAGNLAASYRRGDRNLFQRLQDGEGGSRQPNLTQEQTELVRQLARRESEAQIEMMRKKQADMEEQHVRQMEGKMAGNPTRLRQGRETQITSARRERATQLASTQGRGRVQVPVHMDEAGSSSGSRSRLARVSSSRQDEVREDEEEVRYEEDEEIPDVDPPHAEEEENGFPGGKADDKIR